MDFHQQHHAAPLTVAYLFQSALFKTCPRCSAHIPSTTPDACRGPTMSGLFAPRTGTPGASNFSLPQMMLP